MQLKKLMLAEVESTYDMVPHATPQRAQALASKLMAPILNQAEHPTHVILDNGCTKSMGNWYAVERFIKAIAIYPSDDLRLHPLQHKVHLCQRSIQG